MRIAAMPGIHGRHSRPDQTLRQPRLKQLQPRDEPMSLMHWIADQMPRGPRGFEMSWIFDREPLQLLQNLKRQMLSMHSTFDQKSHDASLDHLEEAGRQAQGIVCHLGSKAEQMLAEKHGAWERCC